MTNNFQCPICLGIIRQADEDVIVVGGGDDEAEKKYHGRCVRGKNRICGLRTFTIHSG